MKPWHYQATVRVVAVARTLRMRAAAAAGKPQVALPETYGFSVRFLPGLPVRQEPLWVVVAPSVKGANHWRLGAGAPRQVLSCEPAPYIGPGHDQR